MLLIIFFFLDEEYKLIPDLFKFDDFDKCIFYSTDLNPTYCKVAVELSPEDRSQTNILWSTIEKASSNKRNYRYDLLRHGICASRKCGNFNETTSECLNRMYKSKYEPLGLGTRINQLHCETTESGYVITTKDCIIWTVLGTYVVFVVLVSVWLAIYGKKSVKNEDRKFSSVGNFLSAFSLVDNVNSIINKNVRKQGTPNNYLPTIAGIRFFASFSVILVHGLAAAVQIATANPQAVEKLTTSFIAVSVGNFAIFVQTFFVLSSFLMTINFYSDLKRVQHVTFRYVLRKIVKRYIRFTSGQIILIALHSTWFIRLSRGPFWEQVMVPDHRQCNEKWWINLLYISNFFFYDGACSLHTWYLSVDFQLTVLGLLILWLTQKNPRRLFLAFKTLLFLQIVWTFLYLRWNDFEFSAAFTPELLYDFKFTFSKEWQATWISTMSNLAGLAWGLIFGYLYSHLQNNAFSTKRVNVWWYAIVIICTFGTIFFSGFYKTSDYYSNSRWFAASYGSIEKVVCVFGISFFIFGTLQGMGGFIRNVLEWAPMHTLGKLSFGAYLIHFVFFSIDNALKRSPTYVSPYLMATEILKNVTLSYLSSVFLTSFVLIPVDNLTNKFL
ncbi:hypothetical protein Zmor_009569 [Zophobas morio]|uniref:Acyltransferase 3 domain-containing protein n=1 Tax=Zophobas morio TaxID=2755281 RepID=A0AA38MIZ1_9CUCU|nr:hypothetical protein Zmor_009569 [Zophobas morio]